MSWNTEDYQEQNLTYLFSHSELSLVIGARTEQHLAQNLADTDWNLTKEQVERLDNVSRHTKVYPYWHQDLRPELKSQLYK